MFFWRMPPWSWNETPSRLWAHKSAMAILIWKSSFLTTVDQSKSLFLTIFCGARSWILKKGGCPIHTCGFRLSRCWGWSLWTATVLHSSAWLEYALFAEWHSLPRIPTWIHAIATRCALLRTGKDYLPLEMPRTRHRYQDRCPITRPRLGRGDPQGFHENVSQRHAPCHSAVPER